MKGGLTRRTLVAGGLLALIVAATFAALLISIDDLHEAADRSENSETVLASAYETELLLVDLETGLRGFLITGDERFLAPWEDARRAFPGQASTLVRLAAVRSIDQGQRARQIAEAGTAYLNDYSVPTVEGARRALAAVRTVSVTDEGKRRVDALRSQFVDFVAAERHLATLRHGRAKAAAERAIVSGSAGIAGSLVLVILFTAYLTRVIVRPVRQAAGMAGRLACGDLTVRMPEAAPGEIGTLERSFNAMAGSLEASRAELAASRARVVAAADETRRRLERDLHDGTQQRLVSLALDLRTAEAGVPPDLPALRAQLRELGTGLGGAVEELRELSRGLHPAVLSRGGLGPALKTLARRSAVPVRVHVPDDRRFAEPVEVAAYYVVSEAITNATKHAGASVVDVTLILDGGLLRLVVRDDGAGGADPSRGSGLIGLKDRIEAIGGTIAVTSPLGGGTCIEVCVPVQDPAVTTDGCSPISGRPET